MIETDPSAPPAVPAIHALLTAAGVASINVDDAGDGLGDVPGGGWIAVTGSDRVRWLNGMVTNSVQSLTPGDGAYSFLLSAQGRIQADATVWAESDRLLLQTSSGQVATLLALLDRFIIMDDVELADVTTQVHGLLVAGPLAAQTLAAAGLAQARPSKLLRRMATQWRGHNVTLVHAYSPLVSRFEVWSDDEDVVAELREELLRADAAGCSLADVELLRIAEGLPRFGKDIRDRELPQETGQHRALHFAKGCYLGQEIVERIRSRGNVHRTFAAFTLSGTAPQPGTALLADGKQVGELTSVATAEVLGDAVALGFIRREALERGLPLSYAGGHAEPRTHTAAS